MGCTDGQSIYDIPADNRYTTHLVMRAEKPDMLGATLMVNREPVGHVEVVRQETRDNGEHLYRYKVYEQGCVLEYGVLTHKESEGPYVLLHKALAAIISSRF
jgi:hypothetical protein